MLLALAKLGHSSATEVVKAVCLFFSRLTKHSDARQQPDAQACANLLWALDIGSLISSSNRGDGLSLLALCTFC